MRMIVHRLWEECKDMIRLAHTPVEPHSFVGMKISKFC